MRNLFRLTDFGFFLFLLADLTLFVVVILLSVAHGAPQRGRHRRHHNWSSNEPHRTKTLEWVNPCKLESPPVSNLNATASTDLPRKNVSAHLTNIFIFYNFQLFPEKLNSFELIEKYLFFFLFLSSMLTENAAVGVAEIPSEFAGLTTEWSRDECHQYERCARMVHAQCHLQFSPSNWCQSSKLTTNSTFFFFSNDMMNRCKTKICNVFIRRCKFAICLWICWAKNKSLNRSDFTLPLTSCPLLTNAERLTRKKTCIFWPLAIARWQQIYIVDRAHAVFVAVSPPDHTLLLSTIDTQKQ